MNDEFIDGRALKKEFIEQMLKKDGMFYGFLQLVKKYPSELCLCFRGNKEQSFNIYYNNETIFKVFYSGRVTVSFNHARYWDKWREAADILSNEYHFKQGRNDIVIVKNDYSIGDLTYNIRSFGILSAEVIEKIYIDIIRPMMRDYFGDCINKRLDRFREARGIKDFYKKTTKLEKQRQQELFQAMKNTQNGYFFYDLEFHQCYKNQADKDADKDANKKNYPDMLAIKYSDGKPVALVFVELKCTSSAMNDSTSEGRTSSGIIKHICAMKENANNQERKEIRVKDAVSIINQYNALGLYDVEELDDSAIEMICKNEAEVLLIFTNEAKELWESSAYETQREETIEIVCEDFKDGGFYLLG